MIKQEHIYRISVLTLLVIAAACTRAIPIHISGMWNFTAVGALAVFSGAQFKNKGLAFLIPIITMAVSDLFIGGGFDVWVYIGFAALVASGMFIQQKITIGNIAIASLVGEILFFLITNFAFIYPWYPHNFEGIVQSYLAGLPLLLNMLVADLIFGSLLFGSFYLLEKRFPKLAV